MGRAAGLFRFLSALLNHELAIRALFASDFHCHTGRVGPPTAQGPCRLLQTHSLRAGKELVQHDAEARRELVATQRELHSEIAAQRSAIDAGRDQLEGERRQIAEQRHRDPLIAAAIQNTGVLIACLLPLIVCLFVIRQLHRDEPDHAAVAELLMTEWTSDQPRLLPGPSLRAVALEQRDFDDSHDAPVSEEPAADFDPPF